MISTNNFTVWVVLVVLCFSCVAGGRETDSYYTINFNDPPQEFFPLPYQKRLSPGKAGPVEMTDRPLRQGQDTGKVYWDVYINAVIQKALASDRTHEGDFLWSGGSVFYFPAGKYHLHGDLFFYHTDPNSPKYSQLWTNVEIRGQNSASKLLAEGGGNKSIYITGYCGSGRYESAAGAWLRDLWTQDIDYRLGIYAEELMALHGAVPKDPKMSHGILSYYIDKLYVHTGGIIVKQYSGDISITDSVFDYGDYSIDIRDHVYTVTIQNNHFWNHGPRVRIVHSQERKDWKQFFDKYNAWHQREGYNRGGLVIINGNRDNTPGTSVIPADQAAFHIENCDNVVFTANFLHDTRQPIDLKLKKGETSPGRILPEANFCNARALYVKNCNYVVVSDNIFAAFWPKDTGVITFEDTHFSTIQGNIISPIGGMNRSKDQISEEILKALPKSFGIDTRKECSYLNISGNVIEEVGSFQGEIQ